MLLEGLGGFGSLDKSEARMKQWLGGKCDVSVTWRTSAEISNQVSIRSRRTSTYISSVKKLDAGMD